MVSLNRADLVEQCLASIEALTTSISYEIHLVAHNFDPERLNAIVRSHPTIVVHRVSGIRGYSQNNNVALRAASGRYVVILNDDTILQDDLFGRTVRFLEHNPDVAGVCPVLLHRNGSLQMGVRGRFTPLSFIAQQLRIDRLLPARWSVRLGAFDRAWLPDGDGSPIDIDAGTGACFIARREALEAIGFLDEEYFLGPDDIDWTVRLRGAGRVVLLPTATLIHLAGSTLSNNYEAVLPTVYAGCYTFFRRYYGQTSSWMVRLLLGFVWSCLLSAGWAVLSFGHNSARSRMMKRARWNCVRFAFSSSPSPEVFARLIASDDSS